MTVYSTVSNTRIPTPTPTTEPNELRTLRTYAAMLERQREYGAGISDSCRAWLAKSPERLALWYELLARCDEHGIAALDSLQAWAFFDTRRKRQYLLKNLGEYGALQRLDNERIQVTV